MFPPILLPFLLAISSEAIGTFWIFNGTVTCPKKNYRTHFQLREIDFFVDDWIELHPYILQNPTFYQVVGHEIGDGLTLPFTDKYYDIEMHIVHDCTSGKRKRKVSHVWGQYLVQDTFYYGTKDFALWDAGEELRGIERSE